jgi:hypothetical protein
MRTVIGMEDITATIRISTVAISKEIGTGERAPEDRNMKLAGRGTVVMKRTGGALTSGRDQTFREA